MKDQEAVEVVEALIWNMKSAETDVKITNALKTILAQNSELRKENEELNLELKIAKREVVDEQEKNLREHEHNTKLQQQLSRLDEVEDVIEKTWCEQMDSLTTNSQRFKMIAQAIKTFVISGE